MNTIAINAPRKRQSGKRNADALYTAWLKRTKIPVDGSWVAEWIEEALFRIDAEGYGGVEYLAERLQVTKRTIIDARKGRVRPMVTTVEKLAAMLGRSQELDELLPPPGVENWSDEGHRYCGDGNPWLLGCGTHFHKHYSDGLCQDCYDGMDEPGFVPRDIRLAQKESDGLAYTAV